MKKGILIEALVVIMLFALLMIAGFAQVGLQVR